MCGGRAKKASALTAFGVRRMSGFLQLQAFYWPSLEIKEGRIIQKRELSPQAYPTLKK